MREGTAAPLRGRNKVVVVNIWLGYVPSMNHRQLCFHFSEVECIGSSPGILYIVHSKSLETRP